MISNRSRKLTDIWFTDSRDGGAYLTPGEGARISPPNPTSGDCKETKYDKTPIRVDGLGPGNDICVRTSDGRLSHIYFDDEVTAGSVLRLWHVTRPASGLSQ